LKGPVLERTILQPHGSRSQHGRGALDLHVMASELRDPGPCISRFERLSQQNCFSDLLSRENEQVRSAVRPVCVDEEVRVVEKFARLPDAADNAGLQISARYQRPEHSGSA